MFRLLIILSVAITLLLSGTSCSSSMKTVEGRKYKPFSKFNFRLDNNQVTSASVYKRYVAYNKKQESKGRSNKPQQVAKKNTQPKSARPKTGLVAVQ